MILNLTSNLDLFVIKCVKISTRALAKANRDVPHRTTTPSGLTHNLFTLGA